MESMGWILVFLVCLLAVLIGLLLASLFAGQKCTILFQRRQTNHELTRIQKQEQENLSSRLKQVFSSSAKNKQPEMPVEDVTTTEFTLKFPDYHKKSEEVIVVDEYSMVPSPDILNNEAKRQERKKKREEYMKKYAL